MDIWILALIAGGGGMVGAALGWIVTRQAWQRTVTALKSNLSTREDQLQMLDAERDALRQQGQALAVENAQFRERAARVEGLEQRLQQAETARNQAAESVSRLQAQMAAEQAAAKDKLELLEQARTSLTQQFKLLATEILEEKSQRFAAQNQQSIGALLDPVRQKLGDFQTKVEQFYDAEGKQRSALSEQVRQLFALNRGLSEDAQNLTRALKGESKTRGNWGELVLERILESLGLQRGREYDVQSSHQTPEGRVQPDVVIHLPDDRHIVVDSKVSLVDWDAAHRATEEGERQAAMKRHKDSLRQHIRQLAAKNYQDLYGISSLDCVVMFVPIEPALLSVVAEDGGLFQEAWQQQVLLVSASTLFFALRTVAYLWRQDQQSRNAQEIARRGAELYDKLQLFVSEMDRLGEQLQRAQSSFDTARGRLVSGKGNVIRQAEMLRELGVKAKKPLPDEWREAATGDTPLLDAPASPADGAD